MESHFKKSVDPRLLVTDDLAYNVVAGAASITSQKVQASSVDTTQAVFNVQVPSQKTCIDTHVEWTQTIKIKVSGTVKGAGRYLVNMGNKDALCAFPSNSLLNTIQCTINNATTATNVKEIMPGLLHCFDKKDLNRYHSTAPVALDTVYNYGDFVGTQNNVLAGYDGTNLNNEFIPRGSFKLLSVSSSPDSQVALVEGTVPGVATDAYITFQTTEPILFCSPWAYSYKEDRPCLTGVNNMNFVMNFNGGDRLLRWVNDATNIVGKVCSVYSVTDSYLNFQMLTPHSSAVMPSRNVLPYYQLPRYSHTINKGENILVNAKSALVSPTMSFNSIPDALVIFARDAKKRSGQSDAFLGIDTINLNWNNNNGLLTGFNSAQLYHTSVKNGSSQNFYEWSGYANFGNVVGNASGGLSGKSLCGSVLVLKFGRDIQLADTEAPGCIGNYQLQFTLNVANTGDAAITEGIELVTVAVNSGLLVTEAGVTSTHLAVLTAADVIKAAEQPQSYEYPDRIIGGGVFDKINSIVKPGRKILGAVGEILAKPEVAKTLKALGSGKNRFL